MNLPNKLTLLRVLFIPFILIFMIPINILAPNSAVNVFITNYGMIIATLLFLIASVTDTMDGQIARKRNQITTMGKFLDPIADKLLVASVLVALVQLNKISAYAVIIIISREFIVSGVRLVAAEKNVVISASKLGKIKTVVQIVAIILIMIAAQMSLYLPDAPWMSYVELGTSLLMWVAVILTVISGFEYVNKNIHFILE